MFLNISKLIVLIKTYSFQDYPTVYQKKNGHVGLWVEIEVKNESSHE